MRMTKLVVVAALATIPLHSQAWNIVCGVSINAFKASTMDTKWEADAAAIKGMSEFYGAIAELQGINVENLLGGGNKKPSEQAKVDAAVVRFKASNEQLARAQAKAEELIASTGPVDNMGAASIGLWKQLADRNAVLIKTLEDKQLPELDELHAAIELTHRIGNVGMRASLMHLGQNKTHHTSGGASARF